MDWDDDGETLEAALALIDEWAAEVSYDESSTTTTGTDSDEQSESSVSAVAPTTRRRKKKERDDDDACPTQMQRRDELVYLRNKVRELEAKLEETHKVKSESLPKGDIDAADVWRQIASHQHEHRQKSEVENARLRVQLKEQLKMAKELTRVLMRAYRRAKEGRLEDPNASASKRIKYTKGGLAEISVADQLQRIEEMHAESERVFAEPPFSCGKPVFRDIRAVDHSSGETTINVDSSWVVPFPVEQVTSAFWTYLIRKTERRECGFQDCAEETKDVLITPYQSTEAASRLVGSFVGRFVAKRIVPEGDKPGLMIWDMRAEPSNFKPMSMDGVRIHNETIMRVIYADSSSSSGRMSLVQMSQRVHVQLAASDTPTRRRRVGALANYMFYNVEAELEWKQRMLETLLLRRIQPTAPVESWSG